MKARTQRTSSRSSSSRPADYVSVAIAYAETVVEDRRGQKYGKWVRLAARRFLADLKRARRKRPPFGWSADQANAACGFIEQLPHVEGVWESPTIKLEPAQVFFLCNLFGFRNADGSRRYTTALYAVGRKNAKALALDTPIPTPIGWRELRDIRPGDSVFGADGRPCNVLGVSETFIGKSCWRVSFADGSSVVASGDHLWQTRHRYRPWAGARINGSGNGGRPRVDVVTTEQIAESVRTRRPDGGVEYNHGIEVCGALQTPDVWLPLDPYLLGAWLGDGHAAAARLTCGDEDMAHFSAEVRRVVGGDPVSRRDRTAWSIALTTGRGGRQVKVQTILRKLGVLGDKRIPDAYLWAGTEQRRALLQGLMDTDGTVTPTGRSGAVSCAFTSTTRALADGVLHLVRSLGIKAALSEGIATLQGRVIGPRFVVQFTASKADAPFRLARKVTRLPCAVDSRSRTLKIVECERVDSVPTRCLAVDSPDRLFLAGPGMTPTHNSALAAAILLYVFCTEPEVGPQVLSAATTGDQARIVWSVAKRMVEKTPDLREAFTLEPFANAIARYETGGTFKPINAKASTQDGLNPSALCFDELHAHKTRDLFDVLRSAAGARKSPLFLYTTTEGFETPGPWPEVRSFAFQVLQGIVEAEHFLAVYYALDEADDDFDESKWVKANPLLDVSISLSELRKYAIEAKQQPGALAEFRIKRLNRQASSAEGHINLLRWRKCDGAVDLDAMVGSPCWAAFDLASTRDMTAWRLLWLKDEVWWTWGRCWVPEHAVAQRNERGTVRYAPWVASGHLTVTDGDVTDFRVVERDILEDCARFTPRKIAYDPWNASQLVNQLTEHRLPLEQFRQGPQSYNPAMQALDRAYTAGNLRHGGNPILQWNAANLVARRDVNMNMAPDRKRSAEKIDAIVALLMAFGVASVPEERREYQAFFL